MDYEPKNRATLEEILASTSNVLFPAEMGERVVLISSTDCDGDTPLHVAVSKENFAIAEALLRAGAKANIRSDLNETAKERAIHKGGELAKLFLQLDTA